MLWTSARRFPDKEALICGQNRLTYRQSADQVEGLAAGLRRIGLKPGGRVGIVLEPSIELATSILAVSQAGGVFVPVNTMLFPEQVAHIANDCAMSGLIVGSAKFKELEPILGDLNALCSIVVAGEAALTEGAGKRYRFENIIEPVSSAPWKDWRVSKDLVTLLYTSGSTGRPKGVMVSHAQLMAGSTIVSTYLEITGEDRLLAILPFSFDAGLNHLMTTVEHGATLVMMSFTFAREIVEMWEREKITGMGGVPTLWSLIAQPSSSLHKRSLPHLRYLSNTGGAMPQSVLATLRAALPKTSIYLMYGLTEAFRSTYLPPVELDRRPTSMGKAIPDTEILVINDDGKLCQPGEVGELVHRGPTVSMGYWGQPDLTAKVLRPNPLLPAELGEMERVCYSGDLVKMDEDGYLYFVGRRDTMIKSSGYRISPTEVEEALFSSGKLREVAVIGLPDEMLGQSIKAYVVPREDESVTDEALLAHCGEKLPRYMVPAIVEFLESLPKTSNGKLDYPALRRHEGLPR